MKQILTFIFICLLSVSCTNDFEEAQSSLEGEWIVTQINFSNGDGVNNQVSNPQGAFTFESESLAYSFIIDEEESENKFDYILVKSRENAGFVKVDRYDIEGEENYRVRFGDETNDAHINAASLQLEKIEDGQNSNAYFILTLEKQ